MEQKRIDEYHEKFRALVEEYFGKDAALYNLTAIDDDYFLVCNGDTKELLALISKTFNEVPELIAARDGILMDFVMDGDVEGEAQLELPGVGSPDWQ